ncbi:MAG: hypothetical protein ACSLFL_10420, partial [Alphaproteobacteria bacterium]
MPSNETRIRTANNRLITTGRSFWAADIAVLLMVWTVWPHIPHAHALVATAALVTANHVLSVIGYFF